MPATYFEDFKHTLVHFVLCITARPVPRMHLEHTQQKQTRLNECNTREKERDDETNGMTGKETRGVCERERLRERERMCV